MDPRRTAGQPAGYPVPRLRGSLLDRGGDDLVRAFRAESMTDLHEKLCQTLVHSPPEKLDVITSVDVQIHDTMAEAMTMDWDFDLKTMWLTKARWSTMARQYINPEELEIFLEKITSKMGPKGRGIAALRTNVVSSRGGTTNKETRRWGSCMLALTYKSVPAPQITLYSRTSYLGYLGALDMTIAWMVGKYVAKELGLDMGEMRFVWHNEAMQFHNFKSLAYLFNSIDPEKQMRYRDCLLLPKEQLTRKDKVWIVQSPALRLSRNWMRKVVLEDETNKSLGDMSYNTYRRIRRRYHTEIHGLDYARQFEGWSKYKVDVGEHEAGDNKEFFKAYQPLPSTPISTLDFSPIGMSLNGVYGAEFEGVDDDDMDENDD